VVTTKYLVKFHCPTAVSWPKIIQPEQISKGSVTYDYLQIKFTFRSGPMIFGRVMALGL
jgi:hypothetical protein